MSVQQALRDAENLSRTHESVMYPGFAKWVAARMASVGMNRLEFERAAYGVSATGHSMAPGSNLRCLQGYAKPREVTLAKWAPVLKCTVEEMQRVLAKDVHAKKSAEPSGPKSRPATQDDAPPVPQVLRFARPDVPAPMDDTAPFSMRINQDGTADVMVQARGVTVDLAVSLLQMMRNATRSKM